MASKTLAGAAASFVNRFFYPFISQKSNPNLFLQRSINSPFLSKFQPWRCLQEEEAANAIKRADFAGVSYPGGIPSSLRFFIEGGDSFYFPPLFSFFVFLLFSCYWWIPLLEKAKEPFSFSSLSLFFFGMYGFLVIIRLELSVIVVFWKTQIGIDLIWFLVRNSNAEFTFWDHNNLSMPYITCLWEI